jgi:hypothetical protein
MDPVSAAANLDIDTPAFLTLPMVQLVVLFFAGALYCFVGYRVFMTTC